LNSVQQNGYFFEKDVNRTQPFVSRLGDMVRMFKNILKDNRRRMPGELLEVEESRDEPSARHSPVAYIHGEQGGSGPPGKARSPGRR
jgi:hypothetical protein